MESSGIYVVWDNPEHTTSRWDFVGNWTWDDWYAATRRALEFRASMITYPVVPGIFNLKHSGPAPLPYQALPHMRAGAEMMDPRDYVVVAHCSGLVRTMIEIFRALNPELGERVLIAETVEDARALIALRREVSERVTGE